MSAVGAPWMISGGGTALAVGFVLLVVALVGFIGGDRSESRMLLAAVGATLVFAGFSFLRFGLAKGGAARKASLDGKPDESPSAPADRPASRPPPAPRPPRVEEERLVICPGCGYQELASRGRCESCGTVLQG